MQHPCRGCAYGAVLRKRFGAIGNGRRKKLFGSREAREHSGNRGPSPGGVISRRYDTRGAFTTAHTNPPPTAHGRRDQSLSRRENCNGCRRGRLPGRIIAVNANCAPTGECPRDEPEHLGSLVGPASHSFESRSRPYPYSGTTPDNVVFSSPENRDG